jgi:parallel beta-helix repeat protein
MYPFSRLALALAIIAASLAADRALAGQGAVRMLYTTPNMSFIEQPSGEVVTNINDASGSIATLQTTINNVRAANPTTVIVIRLTNTTYVVSSAGLVLGSHECLVASGATIQAANASITVPLITIASGSTNVSVSGGLLDAGGANVEGIYAPAAARVNVDKAIVRNCGLDCILLKGNGNSTYDNEMTVTRCDCSGSPAHAGVSIQNSTQTAVIDNNCHNSLVGIYLSCAWATVANNTCESNSIGIQIAGGDDNVVANNTCNNNSTGIQAAASNDMIASDSLGNNSTAGINSIGSGNIYIDNLFTSGNATNLLSAGSGDHVVAYKGPMAAPGQDYFYPPLIDDQHTNSTIVNGMGRADLTVGSTTIDDVQNQYNAALGANPTNVIVLHLNGTFTVGATPLMLASNTCVLLNGTIQINASTGASAAITGTNSPRRVSVSGGVIDGSNLTGNNAIYFPGSQLLQVDAMRLQNFGPDNPRVGSSDILRITGGATPQIVTRCFVTNGAARGIWLENSGVKRLVSDCESTAVNQDGVDCDASTSESVVKFNYCHDLVRYGVFFEQSASHNLALGNICNNCGRDINIYNNSATPRGDTAFNSVICNSLMGNNGLRNGSTGTNTVASSHNFLFNNTVINASISSETNGTQNYYSQNYQVGGSLSTAGTEAFFNSADVSSNLFIQDGNDLAAQAQNASTNSGVPVVINPPGSLGNDQWQFVPTDSGFYRLMNKRSQLAMNVSGASKSSGALVIQWPFGSNKNDQWMPIPAGNGLYYFVNRLSGLSLDEPQRASGTQLDQQPYTNGANQQFSLNLLAATGTAVPMISSISVTGPNVVLTGSNGLPQWPYLLLISTNLSLPMVGWTVAGTNTFDASGDFIVTNPAPPATPELFYRLQLQ